MYFKGCPHNLRGKQGPDYLVDGNGCWIWQKTLRSDGYGFAYVPGATPHQQFAHRVPDGLVIDHLSATPLDAMKPRKGRYGRSVTGFSDEDEKAGYPSPVGVAQTRRELANETANARPADL